ncbi:uncharacterized protein [Aegilops tauschii subsp. strangulata]|nr:uncharacterized protein LOC109778883 [Aegilops tauschii subsp. strangulata]
MDQGEFFLSMSVTDRRVHFSWEVIFVYGPVDHGRSATFLAELKDKVERCTTPVVVAGDFNLIRCASEKSSPNVYQVRMRLFNDCIADLALHEIARVGARFTWTNKQADPIQSVLDSVFVSAQWEVVFPLCSLKAVTRIGSDHTPLLFSLGGHEGLGANLGADIRARKGALLDQIKVPDGLADGQGLSPDDWLRRYSLEASFMDIYKSEELRKCAIPFLWDGDALLENPVDISTHIYSFYKELFSAEPRGGVSLCADFRPLADQVSDAENAELTLSFSPEEVGRAIASMKACSAPGPDGLPVVFFQKFWEILRPVIMPMFHEFYIALDMARINYGVISLIPKVVGATDIRQFRPITVINMLDRIFVKVCATRLSPVAERIAHPLQSAFLKGWRIHDGILALHEIVHEVALKGLKGVFLKLDFQKAYDHLDSSFLRLVMQRRGFDERWCSWIMQLVRSGSDSDIVNLKFLLLCFEKMSGLKINFDKSEVVVLGYSEAEQLRIADNLNCRLASFPISYLGMPLAESRILGQPLLACSHSAGSQFWKSIQAIKEEIRLSLRFSVGNGSGTQFWLDPWLEGEPLRLQFPRLFAICHDPAILVSVAALDEGRNIAFRRSFGPDEALCRVPVL